MTQTLYFQRKQTKRRRCQTMATPRHGSIATTNVSSSPWPPTLGCGNSGLLSQKIWSTERSIVNDYDVNSSDYIQYRTGQIPLPQKKEHQKSEGNCQLLQIAPKPMPPRTTCSSDLTIYPPNHLPSFYRTQIALLNLYLQAPLLAKSSAQNSSTSIVPKILPLLNLQVVLPLPLSFCRC